MPRVEPTPLLRKVLADPSGRKQLRKALTETDRKPEIVAGGRRFKLMSVQDLAPSDRMPWTYPLSFVISAAAITALLVVLYNNPILVPLIALSLCFLVLIFFVFVLGNWIYDTFF